MSKLIVEVCQVEKIDPHPDPATQRLKVATIKGWKTCIQYDPVTGKTQFEVGERCVFFPPDAVLPGRLANSPYKVCKNKACKLYNWDKTKPLPEGIDSPYQDSDDLCCMCSTEKVYRDGTPGRLGVRQYLAELRKEDGVRPDAGRVRATNLRGAASYGLIMKIDPAWGDEWEAGVGAVKWEVGTDVAEFYGITKWEPPLECTDGDAERPHPRFHGYTSIENYGNYPNVIPVGEEVIFTEKIHGKNTRLGLILDEDDAGLPAWTYMAGSHSVRRKEFDQKGRRSEFWEVLMEPVRDLLEYIRTDFKTDDPKFGIVLFGEIYGSGVQDMAYGFKNGARGFRVFDLAVNGIYVDFYTKKALFEKFGVELVPILYRGPFNHAEVEKYTSGPTTVCEATDAGKFKGREGIVITPVFEKLSGDLNGRLILKSVSADYLGRSGGTDSH